jgi:hypothetical protein
MCREGVETGDFRAILGEHKDGCEVAIQILPRPLLEIPVKIGDAAGEGCSIMP